MIRRFLPVILIAGLAGVSTACAARIVALPSGDGTPFPDYAPAYAQATGTCSGVKTLAAILEISGRAGGNRLPRAKVDAGFEMPGKVVLELPAPGRPIFTFVADGDVATLVLPREGRVLRNAPPAATLEALAGVSLAPDELRHIVAGCGFAVAAPTSGKTLGNAWVAIDAGGSVAYLQQVGGSWRLTAATRGALELRYADFVGGRPGTIRLRSAATPSGGETDMTIKPSQVDINEPLPASAFQPDIPAGATPLTLDELRQAGPLGR